MARMYPRQCAKLFVTGEPEKLTAVIMYNLFKACMSPTGSNLHKDEKQALVYWMAFLEACEGISISYPVQSLQKYVECK